MFHSRPRGLRRHVQKEAIARVDKPVRVVLTYILDCVILPYFTYDNNISFRLHQYKIHAYVCLPSFYFAITQFDKDKERVHSTR